MLAAAISHPDCIRHDMGHQHPGSPERLGAVNHILLMKGLLDYMPSYDAPLATDLVIEAKASVAHFKVLINVD